MSVHHPLGVSYYICWSYKINKVKTSVQMPKSTLYMTFMKFPVPRNKRIPIQTITQSIKKQYLTSTLVITRAHHSALSWTGSHIPDLLFQALLIRSSSQYHSPSASLRTVNGLQACVCCMSSLELKMYHRIAVHPQSTWLEDSTLLGNIM